MYFQHFSLKESNNIYFIFVAEWPRECATNDGGFDVAYIEHDDNREPDPDVLYAS
jgi:hypothetical protein